MSATNLVSLEEVSFYYRGSNRPALLNVSLSIKPGEIVGLVGPTGAGKTTLCLALQGIVPQFFPGRFFGRVLVAGCDTVDTPIRVQAGNVGVVMQDPESQLLTASVEDEVAFALENAGVAPAEMRSRVDAALSAVRLAHLSKRHPSQLSGGQKQRLALAAVLAQHPSLVVLDEPTAQLDPRASAEVFALVRELNRTRGTTFVIASHACEELAETVGRVLVLSGGRLVADRTPEGVFRDADLCRNERVRVPEVTRAFMRLSTVAGQKEPPPIRLSDAWDRLARLRPRKALERSYADDAGPGAPLIVVRDATYEYPGGTRALTGVNLVVNRGDYVVLIGQNGAGKSTLLKLVLGLLVPTSGAVEFNGQPVETLGVGRIAQSIGYVGQNPDRQLFSSTVEGEVGFGLGSLGLGAKESEARISTALESLGLGDLRKAHPLSLSRGDRARVVMASALAMEPEVIVFDEPTTGQDEAGATGILDVTARLHRSGKTVIVVTHHLNLMPGYAQRAVVMGEGRVLLDSSLREAYHATECLAATDLAPTQIVQMSRSVDPASRAVTAEEWIREIEPAYNPGESCSH